MSELNRRKFLLHSAAGVAALAAGPALGMPSILTSRRVRPSTAAGTLNFVPHFNQRGRGPHLLDWAYASDMKWDAFHSNIGASSEGVTISDTEGQDQFGVNVRWHVEGYGYIFITADNGGEGYALPGDGMQASLNLNLELATSRVIRNRGRLESFRAEGYTPSRDVSALIALSEEYLADAHHAGIGAERQSQFADKALLYAMKASEPLELDKARFDIARMGTRDDFFIGCDARSFYHMDSDVFMERFLELFDYATITHYIITQTHGMPDFEPTEGDKRYDTREVLLNRLEKHDMTVEGRPLFWPYPSVTPDWLRNKTYDQLRLYVEDHVRKVVGHYGDRMYAWEIVNEFHDWANETQLRPEESVEITKLACEVARDTAPNVHRLINNCCPFAEYVQMGKWKDLDAKYPQRTPWEFMKDLVDAGVDFTITGQQMYFPYRDLQDTIMLVERMQTFGRPVQLTEVGCSSGPSKRSVLDGSLTFTEEPHIWRRPWDEELQADWLEGLYTLGYSKPWIEAVNWYDFVDGQAFIKNGGLLRSTQGERKAAFDRLLKLKKEWAPI
ncbi:MAG TPA: endo-1,4-beta-xylanase [Rhodothermales bacterium]